MSLKYQLRQTGAEVQAAIDKIIALEPGALDAIGIYAHDSTYWEEHSDFVPELGALLIYSDQGKFKLGNGEGTVAELPFLGAALENAVINHIYNDVRHITAAERQYWNNKSDFSGRYQDLTGRPYVPTKLSDLNSDSGHRTVSDAEKAVWNAKVDQSQIADFITKTVDDLTNYYLKSETYTKEEVQQLISTIQGFSYEVVATLPTASAETMGKIYLVPSADPQQQNVKDEYITIDNGEQAQTRYTWEQIGSTAIDLSGYVTTTQLNTALAAYTTSADLTTLLSGKQDVIDASHKLPYSLISDTPTIPDELADLQDDSTHRLVTDTEKSTWNAKQAALVSGTNIKTINNKSLLGPGNIDSISTLNIPVIPDLGEYNLGTKAQAATVLGITEAELDDLMGGNYDRLVFENAIYADRTEAVHTYQSNVSVSYSYTGGTPLRFVFSTDGVDYFSYAEKIVPELSTSISDDGASTTKAATPKAVKDYVDGLPLPTSLGLFQFTPTESSSFISLGNAAAAATALSISESQLEMLYEGGYNKVVLRDSVEGKICIGSESLVNSDATGIAYEIMSGDVTPYMLEFLYESSSFKYRYYQLQGGGSSDAVLYTEQTLTDAQKAQARTNIGAGTSNGGGGTEHNLHVSPNSVIEVSLKHGTDLIPNDTLESSRKIQIGDIQNIAAIYRTATYQRNYTTNIYGQRVLLGLYQSETTFLRCFVSVYNIKAQLQVNGTMVQDVTIGDARTLGINAYGDFAVAYDHNSRKFRLYSYSNNAITQVGEYDISSWDLSSITEVYPVTDVNNYLGHICCETIVINSPLHLDSYIAAPLNVGEYNVPSGTPYSGDMYLAGTGLELDGTITQTISATDKIVTATHASANYFKLGPSNLGDDWQYMWYHVKLRFSSVSEGAYITGALYFGEIVVESGGMPVAWINNDYTVKWYPQADTDYDFYFRFSKNMGGSSKGQTYQRQYGLKLYGTVTMEVSQPYCFNPQVQNICAETYNGAGFDGAIPFDGKCVFVPYEMGDSASSTMRIPIYTIRVDTNGKIYMWNGSVWKQINNS